MKTTRMRKMEKRPWDKKPGNPRQPTGLRGGDENTSLLGSRGDMEKLKHNPEKGGSRTNKKM